jgi:nucleoside-diphosphate-sugar epimerase
MLRRRKLAAAIALADALLISAAPADGRDPVLAAFGDDIARAPRLRSVVYLSTLGVYGDSGGVWIDETTPVVSAHARRGHARIDAERAWQALGARREMPVTILRLGRHLWPRTERNGQASARHGASHRQARPRIEPRPRLRHRAGDRRSFRTAADGVFNVVDDEPAPPSDQIAFAARLLGIEPPPEIPYAQAPSLLSPLALSFYEGCIRARNDKLKTVLGVKLR